MKQNEKNKNSVLNLCKKMIMINDDDVEDNDFDNMWLRTIDQSITS